MRLSAISLAITRIGRVSASFSPLSLFASGEQGAWYDPSDINNYMGPELIVNGTFDSNTDGWIPIEATASVVGGKCVVTNTSNTWGLVTTELQVTVGDTYALSIYFDTTSGYDAAVAIPGLFEDGISAGQTITYSATVVADTNPLTLYIGNADEVVGHNISFDNVSIRRIGEATMFQDAAGTTPVTAVGQPVGLILDKSKGLVLGPELVTNGDFSNGLSGWTITQDKPGDLTVVSGKVRTVSDGITDAGVHNSVGQNITTVVGRTYKLTFDVTIVTSGAYNYRAQIGGVDVLQWASPGSSGTNTGFFTATSTTSFVNVFGISFNSVGEVLLDNISVKEVPGNHASQATSAKRPLLQNDGVNNYLAFDGVDDALATASIDWSFTKQVSMFSGVYDVGKLLWKIAYGAISTAVTNGTFILQIPNAGTNLSAIGYPTSAGAFNQATAARPDAVIVTSQLFDYTVAADQIRLRVDGAQVATTSGSVQAAGFGTHPINLGMGTSEGFNGHIYNLIVLGRLATAQEITDTETWVNSKTGAY